MRESIFQANLIKELKTRFPECMVFKMDASYIQGIPDLLILYKDKWAALECKVNWNSRIQPNQLYFVEKLNDMSFAAFINPENKEVVINDIQRTFES